MIPHINVERRLSKIETLTMAKHYILALTKTIGEMRSNQRNQVVPAAASLSVLDLESSLDEDNLSVVNNLMQARLFTCSRALSGFALFQNKDSMINFTNKDNCFKTKISM